MPALTHTHEARRTAQPNTKAGFRRANAVPARASCWFSDRVPKQEKYAGQRGWCVNTAPARGVRCAVALAAHIERAAARSPPAPTRCGIELARRRPSRRGGQRSGAPAVARARRRPRSAAARVHPCCRDQPRAVARRAPARSVPRRNLVEHVRVLQRPVVLLWASGRGRGGARPGRQSACGGDPKAGPVNWQRGASARLAGAEGANADPGTRRQAGAAAPASRAARCTPARWGVRRLGTAGPLPARGWLAAHVGRAPHATRRQRPCGCSNIWARTRSVTAKAPARPPRQPRRLASQRGW